MSLSSIYDLKLNTDIIHEQGETYRSLLDENQIDLFSDSQIQKQKLLKKMQEQEEQKIEGMLFHRQISEQFNEQIRAEHLQNQLFLQPIVIEKKQILKNNEQENEKTMITGTVLILLVFLLIMLRYFRKRKNMEELK